MKTVIITGSARGFGYAMAKEFLINNCNVVISDVNENELNMAYKKLSKINSNGKVYKYVLDITDEIKVDSVINKMIKEVKTIDVWINNAGVSQNDKYFWELNPKEINKLIDIDLKGAMICTNKILPVMIKQGFGQIYNVEGHGSNDALIDKLTLYGTAKRGITYFTESLAHEVKKINNICVGKITPGIMITNFLFHSLGMKKNYILMIGQRKFIIF